ncbi:hypothetical protein [Pseudoduganella namucuonensis]|uniref:Uncharacterized protein n=1 Tax=Pseudoduganella namucuonensis TaxID=1035707 RepID=A0A1I7LNC8_9BURK|nr:hypothetical protein [Pseudoduganella namucuonensis]SFV11201.1 hypothetical protein SAMN05216552_103357 [Pseudoduganella namucuonensis]
MNFSNELTDWLCLSRTGASLHAQSPAACRAQHCRLCDQPLGVINDALPCLHWLTTPYCKSVRMASVFANYPVVEVVRYVLIWTRSETRRHSARHLRCASRGGATEIHIAFRNRSWSFLLEGEHDAAFEYNSGRSGFGFRIPLTLRDGEEEALRQLSRLG